jgi:HPt (histidine-containing phosphotransfer) domain-containing protein
MQKDRSKPAWNLTELLVRIDDDQELLCELLAIFKEDFPRSMRSLESALIGADMKNAAMLSHTLKGMLSNLGGTRAASAAARIEQLARAGEAASLGAAWKALQDESALLLPELDAYLAEVRR